MVAALVVLAGCGNSSPSLSQQPTSAPTPTVAVASPSEAPSATATEAPTDTPEPTPGLVTIPTASVRSMAEGASVTFGSRVFAVANGRSTDRASITMRDFASTTSTVLVRTIAGHQIGGIAATADRLIWVETWRDHPSPPSNAVPGCVDVGKPLRWRVVAILIASSGVQSVVASGTNLRTAFGGVCNDIDAPVMAADGDRVAYTLEAGTRTNPFANRIVVRSLATGAQIRSITTVGIVQGLDLNGQAILYWDDLATPESTPYAVPFDGSLRLAAGDGTVPSLVDVHVSGAALSGTRVGWISATATDGSVWTESLTSGAKQQLQVVDVADFHPDGASAIAVSNGTVAWIAQGEGSDSVGTSRLGLWTVGGIGPGILDQFGQAEFVGISGGWLAWDASTNGPDGQPSGLYGLPEAALVR